MDQPGTDLDRDLLATLNDLLELDHDAVRAYTIAIETVERDDLREELVRFRDDHQRHIGDLAALVMAHGGEPAHHPHLSTGLFKAAVQAAAAAGGDRAILMAFKTNEGQVRDRYQAATEDETLPADVAGIIERNARDEMRHYEWVVARLHSMGAGTDTPAGRATAALERVHGGTATLVEQAEREARKASWGRGLLAGAAAGAAVIGATRWLRR